MSPVRPLGSPPSQLCSLPQPPLNPRLVYQRPIGTREVLATIFGQSSGSYRPPPAGTQKRPPGHPVLSIGLKLYHLLLPTADQALTSRKCFPDMQRVDSGDWMMIISQKSAY